MQSIASNLLFGSTTRQRLGLQPGARFRGHLQSLQVVKVGGHGLANRAKCQMTHWNYLRNASTYPRKKGLVSLPTPPNLARENPQWARALSSDSRYASHFCNLCDGAPPVSSLMAFSTQATKSPLLTRQYPSRCQIHRPCPSRLPTLRIPHCAISSDVQTRATRITRAEEGAHGEVKLHWSAAWPPVRSPLQSASHRGASTPSRSRNSCA